MNLMIQDEERPPLMPTWTESYRLYGQPHALWLTSSNPAENQNTLERILAIARQERQVPEVVIYAIPHRDMNQASAGGFTDWKAYLAHNRQLADMLAHFHQTTGMQPKVYLEPDSIGHAIQFHRTHRDAASQAFYETRLAYLRELVVMYEKAGAWVYLSAAHSGWYGQSDADIRAIAEALNRAGIAGAHGVVSNISNRQSVAAEAAYLKKLLAWLDHPNPDVIVDTSRNGVPPSPRVFSLLPDGSLVDNEVSGGRQVGRWERRGQEILMKPFTGATQTVSQLVSQQYRFDEAAKKLTAPPWLDPVGAIEPGALPTDAANAGVITRFRFIKPPDEADGVLGYPPGYSRAAINQHLAARPENQHIGSRIRPGSRLTDG